MPLSKLKKVIREWNQDLELGINRDTYLHTKQDKSLARAYLGVRRSGKTTIVCQNAKKISNNACYINFEDPFFINNHDLDLLDLIPKFYEEIFHKKPSVLALDEIQNIPNWERWLRKIIDTQKYQIILTGSSAKLLSSELSSSLTGRCLETRVWPLSFREYIDFKKIKNYPKAFEDYFAEGGFPKVVLSKNPKEKTELLKQYLQDILFKDIVSRYEVRHISALNSLVQYFLTNISSKHSFNRISNLFNINLMTAQEYADYCQNAFLFFLIKKYDRNLQVQTRNPQKLYCIDTGLRQANAFYHSEDIGKIVENIVFIELMRRGHKIFYHQENFEVDFLLVDGLKPSSAINVSYSDLKDTDLYDREVIGMLECLDKYNLDEGLILTKNLDIVEILEGRKLIFRPVYKFLFDV